jgi:hypothetical protein
MNTLVTFNLDNREESLNTARTIFAKHRLPLPEKDIYKTAIPAATLVAWAKDLGMAGTFAEKLMNYAGSRFALKPFLGELASITLQDLVKEMTTHSGRRSPDDPIIRDADILLNQMCAHYGIIRGKPGRKRKRPS